MLYIYILQTAAIRSPFHDIANPVLHTCLGVSFCIQCLQLRFFQLLANAAPTKNQTVVLLAEVILFYLRLAYLQNILAFYFHDIIFFTQKHLPCSM